MARVVQPGQTPMPDLLGACSLFSVFGRMGLVGLVGLAGLFGLLAANPGWAQPAPDDINAQRARIQQQREAVEARHAQALRDCEGRFALTACQDEAKATRRHALEQLRQAQANLDDAWRRQRAKARLEAIDAKTRGAESAGRPAQVDAEPGLDTAGLPGSPAARGQGQAAPGSASASMPAAADAQAGRPPPRAPRTRQVVRVPAGVDQAASAAEGMAADSAASSPGRASDRVRTANPATSGQRPSAKPDRRSQEEQQKAAYERRQAEADAHARALSERNAAQDARRAPAASLPLPAAAPASAAASAAIRR